MKLAEFESMQLSASSSVRVLLPIRFDFDTHGAGYILRGIYNGDDSAKDIEIIQLDGTSVVLPGVPSGDWYPVFCRGVASDDTTADEASLVGMCDWGIVPPDAPVLSELTEPEGQDVIIGWTLPAYVGRSELTAILIYTNEDEAGYVLAATVAPNAVTATLTELTADTPYAAKIKAQNAAGLSEFSNEITFTSPA